MSKLVRDANISERHLPLELDLLTWPTLSCFTREISLTTGESHA